MAEQIECVGGPKDGMFLPMKADWVSIPDYSHLDGKEPHEFTPPERHHYSYNPTTNTYEYKGVRK